MRVIRHECSHCGAGVVAAELLTEGVCMDCQKMFESMIEVGKKSAAKEKNTVDKYMADVNRRKQWSRRK